MSSEFDPYRVWLSIPASEQPANYYRLLGVSLFESDPDVISGAADRQMTHVRTFQTGKYSEQSQKILNELSQARITLLDPNKKASYDAKLHEELNSASRINLNGSISSIHNGSSSILNGSSSFLNGSSSILNGSSSFLNGASSINKGSVSSIGPIGEMKSPGPPPIDNPNDFTNAFTPSHPEHSHVSKNKVKKIKKKKTEKDASSTPDGHAEPSGKKAAILKYLPIIGVAAIGIILLIVFLKLASSLSFKSDSAEDSDDYLDYDSDSSNPSYWTSNQPQVIREESERSAGDRMVKVVNGVEFAFRWCPAGTFTMGSPSSEDGRDSDETQHQVTLTRGFWLLETEVTVGMFRAFVNETEYKSQGNMPVGWTGSRWEMDSKYSWNYTGFILDDNRPATFISWYDAVEFNKWLGKKIGQNVQLPTEAQWEYACRAGSTTAYYWGDNFDREKAHYADNSLSNKVINDSNPDRTAKVKSYKPNAWGFYDMLGNVREWCSDCPCTYPSKSITNPVGPSTGYLRICRGGACPTPPSECRSADRKFSEARRRAYDYGFRCAIVADVETTPQSAISSQQSTGSNGSNQTGLKAGSKMVKTVNGVEFAFRWCPPGTFMMGSPEDESGRVSNERQHQVTLTKGFWILETEVTVGMFKEFVKETGYESKGNTPCLWLDNEFKTYPSCSWDKSEFSQDDNYPVTCISWADAVEFNKWLGRKINQDVELPTEAQWEYACRAGTTGAYAGSLAQMAWYRSNSNCKTHRVAQKTPNDWGIYDMHGNVLEMCIDCKSSYPVGNVNDPVVKDSNSQHAIRGGSFASYTCRSAYRLWSDVTGRGLDLGFRCVIVSDDDSSPRPTVTTDKNAGAKMVKTVDGVEFVFHWCPAGTFMMGSPDNENGRFNVEIQHQVTLTKGFWIMETEVTVGMYRAFINDTEYKTKADACRCLNNGRWEYPMDATWDNPGFSQTDKHPVVSVSWVDATEFCKWLEKKTGIDIKLPTEAQWEYACRAGTTGAFYGNLDDTGLYKYNRRNKTCPVGAKKPNAWGLYDMHGNVWEWCTDWNGSYPRESVTDPTGPSNGSNRIIRGGSWGCGPSYCRSAMRGEYSFNGRTDDLGIRCVSNSPFEIKSGRNTSTDHNSTHGSRTTIKSNANRKTVTINGVEFAFIWCPAGTFTMGSPASEPGHNISEEQHLVTLKNGFWIMETEVTQKQWKAITGKSPSNFKGDNLPVENISWNDCLEFCKSCSKHGLFVHLPTEEQWEYACRAGSTQAYAGKLDEMGWHGSNSNFETHPVGSKTPNAWGIYDMHGNVLEWCIDKFSDYSSKSAVLSERHDQGRVVRGGAWFCFANSCSSAKRFTCSPANKSSGIGFRGVVNSTTLLDEKTLVSETLSISSIGFGESAGERKKFTIKGEDFVFRWCPPGKFTMGSPEREFGRSPAYEQQREVTISDGFWMMETEVTQRQWARIMGNNPSYFKGMYNPVEKVSWNDCQVFCKKTGLSLPSEEQWEYACRAGTTWKFAGNDIGDMAWYILNSDFHTHSVGTKEPNEWGLYDMHGNVWEWCSDKEPNSFKRAVRGGCWNVSSDECRSALHGSFLPKVYNNITGFRCIYVPQKPGSSNVKDDSVDESEDDSGGESDDGEDDEEDDSQADNRRAGSRMVKEVDDLEFAFRWCPAGTFMMGSPESEEGRKSDETRHRVTLTKGFWMLETPVTVGMFKAFVDETGYESVGNPPLKWIGRLVYDSSLSWRNPNFSQNDNNPVTCVSWKDANEFCDWLRKKTGLKIKLPTESQWEYACRAGTTGAYAGEIDKMAWYDGDNGTHPVRMKAPNSWGLYDMHGNVWELCTDWYGDYPSESVTDPSGPSDSDKCMNRGGSWEGDAEACRSANRGSATRSSRLNILGFRVIIEP